MSAEQTRRMLNQIEKDISELSKKSADFSKKEAAARSSAVRIANGISQNVSLATLKSK